MRLPPSVRYLPSRLQAMLNPWLWLSILVTGIVGMYIWEYRQNPGQLPWQLGYTGLGSEGNSTSTDVLLESLTPEEQAIAAELDNIELLLAQLDEDLSALTTGGGISAAGLNPNLSGGEVARAETSGLTSESSLERLNRYVDGYRFLGTNAKGSNFRKDKNELRTPVQRSSDSVLTLIPFSDAQRSDGQQAAQSNDRLSEVLMRQQIQQQIQQPVQQTVPGQNLLETGSRELSLTNANGTESIADGSSEGSTETPSSTTPTFSFNQTGVVPGRLDGLNRPFLRTTPTMSPPPGTTGYVPPASLSNFNRSNQSAGSNLLPTQPLPDAFNSSLPSVNTSDPSQVLPPAQSSITTPLEVPAFSNTTQRPPAQPRNAWDSFFD